MTIPAVLAAGDGMTIERDAALGVARHVVDATALIIGQNPLLTQEGSDIALSNLAGLLGGPHWTDHANALLDAIEEAADD